MDLAGKDYWERVWTRPRGQRVAELSYFHFRFTRLLAGHAPPGSSACEIGCGSSAWLPFLAARGVRVTGIDYSEAGLELLRRRLESQGLHAHLIKGDVLQPGGLGDESFDLVFSLGFIEHFDNVTEVVATLRRCVKPGGVLVTLVPNLVGLWGPVQRRIDPDVYDLHRLYSVEALDTLHEAVGLVPVQRAAYFGGVGLCSVNYSRVLERWPFTTRWVMRGAWVVQQSMSWPASLLPGGGESRLLSAYVVGVYRRPAV